MGFFRSLFAVIAGTVVAFLLGMAFDYFRLAMQFDTEGLMMVFPVVAGAAGFIASIFALITAGGGKKPAQKSGSGTAQRSAAGRGTGKDSVPGMPTFDFDRAKQSVDDAHKLEEK
jgi:hypothetical protein